MKELTTRQREVLDAILNFRAAKGFAPSIRELRPILGLGSLRGVTIHLKALERKGYIQRESTSRSIRVVGGGEGMDLFTSVPLVGAIAAGLPLLAVENVESYVPIPREMAASSDELFALRVRGNSMTGDHIADGDVVVVRRQPTAEDGEIVAALIDDEATVKRLSKQRGRLQLIPSNPDYPPIEVQDSVRVLGKVVGLIRSIRGTTTA